MTKKKTDGLTVLGITGGVGAGKSTVLEYLKEAYGAKIIQCDQVGKDLQRKGGACYRPMISLFGTGILLQDGEIDRPQVAGLIYRDPEKRRKLEEIVHPAVKAEVRRQLQTCAAEGRSLAVIEAALLIEDHYEDMCDEIWYICTSEEKRRERLKKSRGYSDERIDDMFRSQRSETSFREHTQLTIDNTSDIVQNTYEQLEDGLRSHFHMEKT